MAIQRYMLKTYQSASVDYECKSDYFCFVYYVALFTSYTLKVVHSLFEVADRDHQDESI